MDLGYRRRQIELLGLLSVFTASQSEKGFKATAKKLIEQGS